jgi:hypothetical protein
VVNRLVDGIMKKSRKKHHKSAIRMIEEAVHILRSAPAALLGVYYIGSVPFVIGLLYFWADMSRSANAHEYSAMAALGLACLFVWMKFWQTIFMHQVSAQIFDEIQTPLTLQRISSIVATQTLIQATRFLVIPIASLMVIPFGFCYAFYQNVSAHDDVQGQTVRSTCRWAWRQAKLWPRQNHLLIGIYWLFGLVIFVNVAVTAMVIPQLVKTLFGVDSAFTISGIYMFLNTTFWIVVLGITYLLLDPFIKAAYALRCFYGSTLQSGGDLKTALSRILANSQKIVAGVLIVSLCLIPCTSVAQREPISATDLDRSIEETMHRREFAWRMPRETIQPEDQKDKGPLAAAVDWLVEVLAKGLKKIGNWIQKFIEWLEGLLPKAPEKTETTSGNWITPVRIVLIILLILLLTVLAYIFVRVWQRRRPGPVNAVSAAVAPTPDLTDERVKADDLSTSRWLSLAGELAEKGELRLAMRALYLATLSHLAHNEMIRIEAYKSNREYERELKRRAHEHKELLAIFSTSLDYFETVWYGRYGIVQTDFDGFAANHQRIIAFVEK